MEKNLNFGIALEAAKEGKLIAREGWNGKNLFVFMRPSDRLSVDVIVNKIMSLPKSVKDYFDCVYHDNDNKDVIVPQSEILINFTEYLCIVDPTTIGENGWLSITNGWVPSQLDILSNDWFILE